MCMFLMKCGGYVRTLKLMGEIYFFMFGKLIMHRSDNIIALCKAV